MIPILYNYLYGEGPGGITLKDFINTLLVLNIIVFLILIILYYGGFL